MFRSVSLSECYRAIVEQFQSSFRAVFRVHRSANVSECYRAVLEQFWSSFGVVSLTHILVFVVVKAVIVLLEAEPATVPDGAVGLVAPTGRLTLLPQITDEDGRIVAVARRNVALAAVRVLAAAHGQDVARTRHFHFQFVRS